jgi:hypothetical protein
MKKLITLTSLIALTWANVASASFVTSIVVAPATMTNIVTSINGSVRINSVTLSATTSNATVVLYDTPTNVTYYLSPAYSNTLSFATNIIYGPLTNYYGNIFYLTNMALIDVTTNVVAATSNTCSGVVLTASTNGAVTYNATYNFNHGIWATNTSSGSMYILLQYTQ